MRVIDADEALQLCDNDIETMKARIEGKVPFQVGAAMVSAAKELRNNLKEYLDKTPTLDCEPVRHGEWIEQEDRTGDVYFTCSVCKEDWFCPDGTPAENNMHFCPCCGAKMEA